MKSCNLWNNISASDYFLGQNSRNEYQYNLKLHKIVKNICYKQFFKISLKKMSMSLDPRICQLRKFLNDTN